MTDVYPMNVDADIHSITPQVGSVHGGTVITITGTGFQAEGLDEIAVDINGIPCRVCKFVLAYKTSTSFEATFAKSGITDIHISIHLDGS